MIQQNKIVGIFNKKDLSIEKQEIIDCTAEYWVSMIKDAADSSNKDVLQLADVLGENHKLISDKKLIRFKNLLSKYIADSYPKKGSCTMIWTGDGKDFIGDNYLIDITKSSKISLMALPYDVCTIIRPGSVQAEVSLQSKEIYRKSH